MREPLYPHFHIYEIASRKSLFTQRRGETVLKVPEGSTTQLQGQPKGCFSAHFGLRIQATSTLRASLAPFSDSLSETVRKVFRATLQPRILPLFGAQIGPERDFSALCRATLPPPPRLFGQSRRNCPKRGSSNPPSVGLAIIPGKERAEWCRCDVS